MRLCIYAFWLLSEKSRYFAPTSVIRPPSSYVRSSSAYALETDPSLQPTAAPKEEKELQEMEFPGRIYLRTEEDIGSPEHLTRVENWIRDYEKNKQLFVYPERPVRILAYVVLVLGLLTLIFQVFPL